MKTRNRRGRKPGAEGPLAQRVVQQIKEDIFRGKFLPRESLVEAELAARYEVSKTPVREALLLLVRGGLVEIGPFRGGRVRSFTPEDVVEIYDVRALLEPFAVERSVPRMDEGDRDLLGLTLREASLAAEAGDLYALSRLNRTFHRALVARCDNSRVIETLDQLQDQLRAIALRSWDREPSYAREADQHEEIRAAVVDGDAGRAAGLLRAHILEFKDRYVEAWRRMADPEAARDTRR